MRFSEYMTEWLYAEDGYYATYRPIGKQGDFYTAVSASKFFGGTVAKHLIDVIDEGFLTPNATVCEIGAHHGYLLADIVEFIYTLRPELLKSLSFAIVERFEHLREQQRRYFADSFGDAVTLRHYSALDQLRVEEAFFVANEIFDAFPCELYYKGKTGRVENHEVIFDLDDAWVKAKAEQFHKDRGEIAVGYEDFAREMAQAARRSEFITFDYGEMQARPDVSLRVYKEHEVFPFFDDALDRAAAFKKSDITYDVTFAHVKEAFEAAGMPMAEYATQMKALVEMGILELLEILRANADEKVYKQELEKVKTLIMPQFLGERFKMIRFRTAQ
ncbi:SAM-dependent methyltransferase [Sulfurimonas sp. HSL-3221]|uniref:SAM-dependent methyltransferase n=1 Tax=Sulfurimonadaceae TaxID=2771471 RepID=UPI001E4CA4B0|nr:SAM-dependent methyltransferase [Sulfurimonas sp. HSL-3221]UFS63263.1 SAM-dependent methyltransferase [Sulfurimonas sp. HSL-3221]